MKPTRFAYVCRECGHCKLLDVRRRCVRVTCPLCLDKALFLLCAVVTDHGEYEEWERV